MNFVRTSILAASLLLAGTASYAASEAPFENKELTRALAGRVAGEPVRCIDYGGHGGRSVTIIPRVGILYEGYGGKLFLNQPDAGRDSLDDWDVLLTDVRGGMLCEREIVKLIDPSSGMLTGLVSLGKFVPYTRVKRR